MKLVASMMIGPGEERRYLEWTLPALLEFCDEVAVRIEAGPAPSLFTDGPKLRTLYARPGSFFEHEGRARQELLSFTLESQPTHVLAIDADEFVSNGATLRRLISRKRNVPVWSLAMEEVWQLDGDCLCVREDGGWRTHQVPVLWKVPNRLDDTWRIADRQLACGREPMAITRLTRRAVATGEQLLHLGWLDERERQARYERYAVADGGRFHASAHLRSILWPPERIHLRPRTWPPSLQPLRDTLEAKVGVAA